MSARVYGHVKHAGYVDMLRHAAADTLRRLMPAAAAIYRHYYLPRFAIDFFPDAAIATTTLRVKDEAQRAAR